MRLVSRNGRDHTKRFHAIAEALTKLKPKSFTLDGEVAVFDEELISRFGASPRCERIRRVGRSSAPRLGGKMRVCPFTSFCRERPRRTAIYSA